MKKIKIEKIDLFTTGGTIDKIYNPLIGKLYFGSSNIPHILTTANLTEKVDIQHLMAVDSLEMTSEQRKEIVSACITSHSDKIIITHGTDTMVATATEIAAKNLKKTIILTGAMVPYSLENSDATFNIANALAFVKTLKKGVYIVMNGHAFLWDNVQKNKQLGVFQSL